MQYVGKTLLGGKKGEGIVVKNQTTLNSDTKKFYIKIVDAEFQETNASRQVVKTMNINEVLEMEEKLFWSKNIVTLARVRKIIHKMVDFNELPSNWEVFSEAEILKLVKPNVYRDCIKEEKDTVEKVGKIFGKHCNDLVLKHVKTLKDD